MANPPQPLQLATTWASTPGAQAVRAYYTWYNHTTAVESGPSPLVELDWDGSTPIKWANISAPVGVSVLPDSGDTTTWPDFRLYAAVKAHGTWTAYHLLATYLGPHSSTSGPGFGIRVLVTADILPPADWIRVIHADAGTVYETNGEITNIYSTGTLALQMPFATLDTPPGTVMGQDPDTGLPAFCPPPPPPIASPPISPPATSDICVQVRCGVAFVCMDHLTSLYAHWANWINGALTLIVGAITAAALALLLDPLMIELDIALWAFIRPILLTLSGSVISAGMGTMTSDRQTTLARALFCQLACTNDVCTLDANTMIAWSNALTAGGWSGFDNLEAVVLNQLILRTPMTDWQSAAATAGQNSSCDGWTCP